MPTVLRQDGFRVVIYLNDYLPAHVHVLKGNGEVRINMGSKAAAPSLIAIFGNISDKDAVKVLSLVKAQWRKIHG